MNRLVLSVVLLGSTVAVASATEKPKKALPTEGEKQLAAIEKAFEEKLNGGPSFSENVEDYSRQLLAHAKKYPDDASAPLALVRVIVRYAFISTPRKEATTILEKQYVKSPLIRLSLSQLLYFVRDEDTANVALVDAVFRTNTDRLTRATAGRVLARALERSARQDARIESDEKERARWVKMVGKDGVEKRIAKGKEMAKKAIEYRAALRKNYNDIFPSVAIGEPAPPTVSVNLDGKAVKLSDLKGKVVVLDFWGINCPPCIRMIPHSRELVKKLAGRPFSFVGISRDQKKETLTAFLEKTKMPWTHWWDPRREAGDLWEVEGIPTVYVVDHKGIIRYHEVGFGSDTKKLDALVEKLVEAAEAESASSR